MTPRLTDDELYLLVSASSGERWRLWTRELRFRTRMKAITRAPSPRGTCANGLEVTVDDKGALSTGYLCHVGDYSVCEHGAVQWHRGEPRDRLVALAASLRD